MENRHFRKRAQGGSVWQWIFAAFAAQESLMNRRILRRTGLATARRDLLADWRRWSAAEKSAALATLIVLAVMPVVAWAGFIPG